jgi:Flp pilus assembly protein TadG
MSPPVRKCGLRSPPRRGAAAVEFAVCMPVIVVIVFASIEACSMIFLKQALEITAYETVRAAIAMGGTSDAAKARGDEMLAQRNVKQGSVTIAPGGVQSLAPGTQVTVTATAPIGANRVISSWFFSSGDLSASCMMLKEGNKY